MPSLNQILGQGLPLASLAGVKPGDVLSFEYADYHRDPRPVVLILRDEGSNFFGINLHYITFPIIQNLFNTLRTNPSYEAIKNIPGMGAGFRRYKKSGIRRPRTQGFQEIIRRLKLIRVHTEDEVEEANRRLDAQTNPQQTDI